MKSWTNWQPLNKMTIALVPDDAKGVYAIRRTMKVTSVEPDLIYIGASGTGKQGIRKRLKNLVTGLNLRDDSKAKNYHSASPRIRKYISYNLEFSWIKCFKAPDGVEKALLLAFWISTGGWPVCNTKF